MTDNRTIIATVVGTGIAMTTVIVAFIGIIAGGINGRFDDVNNRIGDMNSRFDDLNDSVNTRIDDMNANLNRRIDDLQTEMRELRALVIDAIKGGDPAANE